jgi:glycosyltransferase involved in cell wall biosynthesis
MLISVITVCFNSESTIRDTVSSVARQSLDAFEHIIIDGNSTDSTVILINSERHARLKLVSEPDEGIYWAMNKGLEVATGEYVAFLNADDFYKDDNVLLRVADVARKTGSDLILGNTEFLNSYRPRRFNRLYSAKYFRRWWIKLGIMPPHPSLFARRTLLNKAGGFDTSYKICADFDLIARLILQHNASWASLNHTTTVFREGGLSTSGEHVRKEISLEFARSLKSIGILGARWRVMLRYPFKALQYLH